MWPRSFPARARCSIFAGFQLTGPATIAAFFAGRCVRGYHWAPRNRSRRRPERTGRQKAALARRRKPFVETQFSVGSFSAESSTAREELGDAPARTPEGAQPPRGTLFPNGSSRSSTAVDDPAYFRIYRAAAMPVKKTVTVEVP